MRRKGFTLVELMVVILIVGILAAVAIPIMRGRINSAKWSEGKSMMGTIATAIRAYVAEKDAAAPTGGLDTAAVYGALGFHPSDLDGTYFEQDMFEVTSCSYDPNQAEDPLEFVITATNSGLNPGTCTLDEQGAWGP